ncbi:MAG: hypothetical protein KME26_11140 [Oscillatoria princeps RMCB-10]|jgi:Tfp pilus assembly protein FimT|nr:hypothetical protein [Oscillatoria princeps RMCB-10]
MNTPVPCPCLFSALKKNQTKGLTLFDLLAEIFLIAILLLAVPVLLSSPVTGSSAAYRNRATLTLRFIY